MINGSSLRSYGVIVRGALATTTSAIALSAIFAGQAMAQSSETQVLPPVNVDPPGAAAAKPKPSPAPTAARRAPRRAARPKPKPRPAPPPEVIEEPEPVFEPVEVTPETASTGEARDAAMQTQVYNTPAAVSSVGSGEMATFGSADPNNVLRAVPGTSVRDSPNNPGVAVNIRGFEGSGRVNMMIDGVRQNFRFTGHEAQGFTYVDPSLLAGVDIARGAVSTAGGAGALAGAANFRTLDIIDVLKPGQTVGALTSASYGTNSQEWTGMAAGAVSSGNVGFVGAISGRNPDDFENGDDMIVPYTSQDLRSGLVKGEFKINEEHKFKVGGVFYRNDFLANSYDQKIASDIYTFNYNYNPVSTNLVNLRFNAYRSDVTMNYGGFYNNPIGGAANGREINDVGTGFDISNVSKFRLGDVNVRSEYGYEYFHDDYDVINSAARPDRGVNPSGESAISGLFSATTFSYGMFDLIAGLRYDEFKLDGRGSVAAGNPLGMPAGPYKVDRTDGRFDPKITLAVKPVDWFQPYVTYAEAMRGPTVNETFMGGNHPGAGPAQSFFPNPFLEPEIQKGWEFGFNSSVDRLFTHNDFLRFKANYFTQDVENYITACFNPGGGFYFCNNDGTSDVQGVELQGMYDAGIVFAGVSYTWVDTNLPPQTNGAGSQTFMPDHVFSVSGGVRLFQKRWTIGGRVFYASDAYVGTNNVAPNASPYTDGYTLVDLYTSFKLTPDIEVGATMTNVMDVGYTPATSTSVTGGFDGETGRGRTTLFTARAKF